MTDKTEAQPEALRLADSIEPLTRSKLDNLTLACAATELRRQHAESLQLREALTAEREAYIAMPAWYEKRIKDLEAQLSARQAAPDGWRLVPELPTLNMLNTAFGICTENGRPVQQMIEAAAGKYAAMLSAAPPTPEREPQKGDQ